MKTGLAFLLILTASASSMAAQDKCKGKICPSGGVCDPQTGLCTKLVIKKLDADHNVFEVVTEKMKSIRIECQVGSELILKEKAKESDADVFICQDKNQPKKDDHHHQ